MSPGSEEYEGKKQDWTSILEGELGKAREIQSETAGLGCREVEQAVVATFLHSQPVGQKAALRDLTVLLGSTRPDRIGLEKALRRWTEVSWFLDEAAINDLPTAADGRAMLPKSWRLGSRPNLTQMHHDARTRVSPDLVEAKLLKSIETLKPLTAGTSGDGYKVLVHNLPDKPKEARQNRSTVSVCMLLQFISWRTHSLRSSKRKYITLKPLLDERARRLWAAVEARSLGRGGIIRVAEATGLARATIRAGLKELALPISDDDGPHTGRRLRPPGGGRKPLTDHDPALLRELEALVDPVTRGDPMSPLLWTCKSAEKLAEGLQARGHVVSERTVNRLLHDLGYSLPIQSQDDRGQGTPGQGCPIPVHQPESQGVSAARTARDLGRYQEERACGAVPQRRAGVATQGEAREGEGP